ncbi:MAG: apolipoprotein N-acyltransferase [Nitrospirae bacterium]|nr:MAG: apolipoprotein N-acyltransferase [Nitrospirota bacterium]
MVKIFFDFLRRYGYALLSGLLIFLSFPTIDLYLLAWVGIVPFLFSIYGKESKEAFKAGFLFGLVYFFGTTFWIYHSIHKYGGFPFSSSIVLVFLLCAYLSLYPSVFAFLYARTIRKTDLPSIIVAPALWTSLEYLRSYAFTGFPWSSIGYSQYKFLPFIQVSDITGIYGISFLVIAFNAGIVDLLLLKRRRTEKPLYSRLPTIFGFTSIACFLIFSFSYGFYRLYEPRDGKEIKTAIIQGNIEQDRKWDSSYQQFVISAYKELTLQASEHKPDLIIWPETSLPFFFGKDKPLTEDLVFFQQQLDAYLLFGSVLEKKSMQENGYTNSAVLLNKSGSVSYIYDKIHLVPFGEYVPLRTILFFIDKLVYGIGDYVPGNHYLKAITPFGSFGTAICYEIIFPGLVRKFFTRGGDFMVTMTNDAWFGNTAGPYQHFSMSVFRAIENRKPVLRAANSGISGFIDSNGRIIDKTGLFEKTFSVFSFKTDQKLSFYTKYGDIFSYFCIVFSLLFISKRLIK